MNFVSIKNKFCSSCGLLKNISEFSKNRSCPEGLAYQCKKCFTERYGKKNYPRRKWKHIIIANKEYKGYSISNDGKLLSHLKKGKKRIKVIDPSYSFYTTPTIVKGNSDSPSALRYFLTLPADFFEGTPLSGKDFRKSKNGKCIKCDINAHKLVMDAFKPIDDNPPYPITKEDWDKTPESSKQMIRDCIVINHIDHNPLNNRIDNLEYTTPRENARKARDHYGGNVANKTKVLEEQKNVK